MTRINCIPVEELNTKFLVAEHHEITRARSWHIKDRPLPPTYRMGKGHCLFFHNKGLYLIKRHQQLIEEMAKRGFQHNIPLLNLSHWPKENLNDWTPNEVDLRVNRERIKERTLKLQKGS